MRRFAAIVGTAVLRMVASRFSMNSAVATIHGRKRRVSGSVGEGAGMDGGLRTERRKAEDEETGDGASSRRKARIENRICLHVADAAKADGMAYVVMSQLNRQLETRDDKRPLPS